VKLIVDATVGTHILGSKYERLETTYRDRHGDAYVHPATGILAYDPTRQKGKAPDPWWLIAYTDDGIAAYYRHIVEKRFGFVLDRPSWGAHVSIIRGEEPKKNLDRWRYNEGLITPFAYSHDIYTNGAHWWVNVDCLDYANLRDFYGFDPGKRHFHLSIGRVRDRDIVGKPPEA